jgi:hypothetical protein
MTNHMMKQEEARKKKETERKRELDALEGSGNLAQNALKARADNAKGMKKSLELGAKKHRKVAAACATKRKADKKRNSTTFEQQRQEKESPNTDGED